MELRFRLVFPLLLLYKCTSTNTDTNFGNISTKLVLYITLFFCCVAWLRVVVGGAGAGAGAGTGGGGGGVGGGVAVMLFVLLVAHFV